MADFLILDGGTGTMLQAAGLQPGENPSVFGMKHPDVLEQLHRDYVKAGSQVLCTNTFSANADKLRGTGYDTAEVVAANVKIAKHAADGQAKVALDIGPIGVLMAPYGTLTFERAYALFAEILRAGEAAGADLVFFETMTELSELRAGVLAAKECTSLPVWASMSFESNGRTFMGTSVESMALTLEGLGVDAMGINCSLGPAEVYPLICRMRCWTDKPLLVKPNAGLPDPVTGAYGMDAAAFQREMAVFADAGVFAMGGCCGTTPDFIRGLSSLEAKAPKEAPMRKRGVCSASQAVSFEGIRVVGERLNPTGKKRFQQALRQNDLNYMMELAIAQEEAGADILDVNVGCPGIDEAEMMAKVVRAVQSVTSVPLQIDSSHPAVIEAGLRACTGRAIVNSVDASPEKLAAILPIVKKYGAAVVGLTMDRSGIPQTAEERVRLAEVILDAAKAEGIPQEDVLIDCLTLTVSAQQEQAAETLRAVRLVREKLGVHATLGVSNISFGLPQRTAVTTAFLIQAIQCGLDFPILNPNNREMMDAVAACRVLANQDTGCGDYIRRFADAEPAEQTVSAQLTIAEAVRKGLPQETAAAVEQLLQTMTELDVVNQELIPALDAVGRSYEAGTIFLPQLINAANAACAGFDLIKQRIARRGGTEITRGRILLATVEGDIHDIGKNIVRVVLENYGYQVLDLGRDVPPDVIVEAALREDIRLVGLSALMTTTVSAMERTIAALRDAGCRCKVMVGGAVLTADYAAMIGADYYTKDATASVHVAQEIFADSESAKAGEMP